MSTATATAPHGRRGLTATGSVVIGPGRSGRPRLVHLRTTAPLGVKLAGGDVHLMGTAGGPLGGDDLALSVRVISGTAATVRSVAATIALPGDGRPSHQHFDVTVEAGATLRWLPEPFVAAAGCDHHVRADVSLEGDAALVWVDEIVLGRTGEQPGRLTSTLRVTRDGRPLVHQGMSTHQPGWAGPAITAGARVITTVLYAGSSARSLAGVSGVGHAVIRLAEDLALATTLGPRRTRVHLGVTASGHSRPDL